MSKTDILRAMDYLGHIVEAIDRIQRYVFIQTLDEELFHKVVASGSYLLAVAGSWVYFLDTVPVD